jgi:hypothetical protein
LAIPETELYLRNFTKIFLKKFIRAIAAAFRRGRVLHFEMTIARDVMSAPLKEIDPHPSLWQAHERMQTHRIQRLVLDALDPLELTVTRRLGELGWLDRKIGTEG